MGKIIEFAGMPAAGKSTQIELIINELEKRWETFTLFNEGEIDFEEIGKNFMSSTEEPI